MVFSEEDIISFVSSRNAAVMDTFNKTAKFNNMKLQGPSCRRDNHAKVIGHSRQGLLESFLVPLDDEILVDRGAEMDPFPSSRTC